jgi:hypothetical protein
LIDVRLEFDRPDRRSREPIAHIRQYYRARAIGISSACRMIPIAQRISSVTDTIAWRNTGEIMSAQPWGRATKRFKLRNE